MARGVAVALIAAFFFAVLFFAATGVGILSALLVAVAGVYFSLWFVLSAGALCGYLTPEIAQLSWPRLRLAVGALLGLAVGGFGGITIGRELSGARYAGTTNSFSPAVLGVSMGAYASLLCLAAVWFFASRRLRRDV